MTLNVIHGAVYALLRGGLVLALSLLVTRAGFGAPASPRITVQAQTRLNDLASAVEADGSLTLSGQLVDDTGAGLPNAALRVGGGRATELAPCGAQGSAARRRGAIALVTDAAGAFCLRVTGELPGALEIEFPGTPVLLPTRATFEPRAARAAAELRFDSPSLELDLDNPEQHLQLTLTEPFPPDAEQRVRLTLHDGGRQLPLAATSWHREGNVLRVTLRSSELGAPGAARLAAALATEGGELHAESVALRIARVGLSANIVQRDAEGATLRVSATAAGAAPDSGWIDVTQDGQLAPSGRVEAGHAQLEVPLGPEESRLVLSYRGEDPWWLPGAPIELVLEGVAPPAPRRWPWLVLLVPVGWVCLKALQRPAPRAPRSPRRPPPRAPVPAAAFAAAPLQGWSGTVFDAHDGWPVAGARIELALPSLRTEEAPFSTVSDVAGAFTLPALTGPVPEGARLRVSAALHTEVERALPPQGRVDIALMSRRRVLLRRLVRWARSMGPPWNRSGEPTPREIADVALRRGEPQTARWAEGVERAAFGGSVVDREREASLRAQEPPWKHSERERRDDDEI